MAGRIGIFLTVALMSGACVAAGSPGPGGIAHPTGASDLVLRIETGGGLINPAFVAGQIPQLSIFGDGRVITTGPQIAIYPGPALPNVIASRISEEGLQKILENAQAAGLLGPDAQYDFPLIADAPTTTFTVVAAGGRHVISAYALAEAGPNDAHLDPDVRRARAALFAFEQRVTDLRGMLGTAVVEAEGPYVPTSMRILAMPAQPDNSSGIEPNLKDWPLATPLATFGAPGGFAEGMRCGTVSGAELTTLMPLLQASNQLTYWRSGGQTFQLTLRPLLPDETGCPPTT